MTEPRAKALLDKFGIKYEPEPEWITSGRKPDFYCSEPEKFWCEVKTLERTQDSKRLSDTLNDLANRASSLSEWGIGMGIAHVSPTMSHKDAKLAIQLSKRPLKRMSDLDAPDVAVALIPKNMDRKRFVRFSLSTRDKKIVEFHSVVSTTGRYAVPSGMYPEPDSQILKLKFSSGRTKEATADSVIEVSDDFRVAIAIHPRDTSFEIAAAMPTGAAQRLNNVARIRDAVSDANEQVKNANTFRPAPSVTLIFHDGLDVPDEAIIKSALYGI